MARCCPIQAVIYDLCIENGIFTHEDPTILKFIPPSSSSAASSASPSPTSSDDDSYSFSSSPSPPPHSISVRTVPSVDLSSTSALGFDNSSAAVAVAASESTSESTVALLPPTAPLTETQIKDRELCERIAEEIHNDVLAEYLWEIQQQEEADVYDRAG